MASKFKRIRNVTLPVLKLGLGQPRFLYILGPMKEGPKLDDKKEPAILIHAADMETGEEGNVIAPAILRKELTEGYPGDGYVDRGFEVTKTRDPEKKYNHVSIAEVAVPDDFVPPATDAALAAEADSKAVAEAAARAPKKPAK